MEDHPEKLRRRVAFALHGRPTPVLWEWMLESGERLCRSRVAPGSVEAYSQRLEQEDDPLVFGELLERAWNTPLTTADDLERGWQLGGRARLSAVLDPRCDRGRVTQWVREWCEGQEQSELWNEHQVISMLSRRHRHSSAVLIQYAPQAWLNTREIAVFSVSEGEWGRTLRGAWAQEDAASVGRALHSVREDPERLSAASRLLTQTGWQHWMREADHDLSLVPAEAMRSWALGPWWATGGRSSDVQLALCEVLWPQWTGNGRELLEQVLDILGEDSGKGARRRTPV